MTGAATLRAVTWRMALLLAVLGCSVSASCGPERLQQDGAKDRSEDQMVRTLKSLSCKAGEQGGDRYPSFPFFLQKVPWSGRQFYAAVGADYRERHRAPFDIPIPDGAKRFQTAAQGYVTTSDSLWKGANSPFRVRGFHREAFEALLEHYAEEKAYAGRLSAIAVARGKDTAHAASAPPPDGARPSGLSSAAAQPEIVLLTAALNSALVENSDLPIRKALATIRGAEFIDAIYRNIEAPSGCLGCAANASPANSWLPDSLKSYSGADIWKILLLRHARESISSREDVEQYAVLYRKYIKDYDLHNIYPTDGQTNADRWQLLRSYYPGVDIENIVSRGVCSEYLVPLKWDEDIIAVSARYRVKLNP